MCLNIKFLYLYPKHNPLVACAKTAQEVFDIVQMVQQL